MAPPRKPTPAEVEAYTSQILYNRIAWTAARELLTAVVDPLRRQGEVIAVDGALRERIETFLARHPLDRRKGAPVK